VIFDSATEFGARAAHRVWHDRLGWLSSVRPNGSPHTHQVWFYWNGASFLLFARAEQERLGNIRQNPNVTLHLESNGDGRDLVILEGQAEILAAEPPEEEILEYLQKYSAWLTRLNWDREFFRGLYSVPYRVTPTSVTGL